MSGPHLDARARAFAGWWVRLWVRAYPEPFRRRFAGDLRSALEDRLDEAWASRAPLGRAMAVIRMTIDVVFTGLRERARPTFRPGGARGTSHDQRTGGQPVDTLVRDIRFAVRALVRRPGFTAVALFTLALGIGASTAVFTVVDGVLLKPLPYPDPERLVMTWSYDTDSERVRGWMSQPDIESLRALPVLGAVEGVMTTSVTLTGLDRPERLEVARSTGGVLDLLGVPTLMGRDLRHEDNHPDAPRVVVVSHDFWQTRLGARPDVIGSTIQLNELTWEIVGVAPAGYRYPEGVTLWQPYRLDVADGCGRGCHVYDGALARVAPGTGLEVAGQALQALAASLADDFPDTNIDKGLWFEPLIDVEVGEVRTGLWVVLGAVGLVLLIVCANTASLLLVRASARAREVAVRAALGASKLRLFTQVVTESLLLAVVGGALGLGLSFGLLDVIRRLATDRIPRLGEVSVDGGVVLFLLAVTGAVALLFGLSPAVHVARGGGSEHLLGGARGRSGGAGARLRSAFLAIEVAFSVVLLAGSGLLLRSLDELYRVDLGFDGERVTRFALSLPGARYGDLETIVPFYRDLEQRIGDLPGVESVGSVYGAPLSGGNISGTVLVEGRPNPEPGQETGASMRPVTPGYFETMGIEVLRGRGIEVTDETEAEAVAVVNETFVEQNFPGEEILGARVRITASFGYGSPYWRVVGVVRDVRRSMAGRPTPEVYAPHTQYGPGFLTVHARVQAGAANPIPAIRDLVAQIDPNLVVRGAETVSEAKRRDTAATRLFLTLVTAFAGVAIVLAGVGLYGVVAFLVGQRTREIGIRMALGAGRTSVTRMVVRQGLTPTALGVALGLLIALQGGRVMESMLFGVEPTDPIVLGGVAGLVLAIAVCATLLPARRATRVDPTEALRIE